MGYAAYIKRDWPPSPGSAARGFGNCKPGGRAMSYAAYIKEIGRPRLVPRPAASVIANPGAAQ